MEFETYTYQTKVQIGEREATRLWTLRKNTQDEFIVKEVYEQNCYKLPDDLSGKVIVDIGANIGAFAAACVDRGAQIVWSYDPQVELTTKLFPNLVVITPAAIVGDEGPDYVYCSTPSKKEEITLTGGIDTFTSPIDSPIYSDSQRLARTMSISGTLREILIDVDSIWPGEYRKIWIKLDCEGSEYEILASNLPWSRIERIFGECHTLIDGKLSKDTAHIENGRFPIEPNRSSLGLRLMSVGYQVSWKENPDDKHLCLFWAENWRDRREEEESAREDMLKPWERANEYGENPGDVCCQRSIGGRCFEHNPENYKKPLEIGFDEKGQKQWRENHPFSNATDEWKKMSEKIDLQKTVCILTPFRNARRYLPLYFRQLTSLRDLLSENNYSLRLVAAEGDSLDGTHDRIIELSNENNIPLTMVDTTHGHMKWGSVEDPVRMRVMSDVMNKTLDEVRESDDIVVWIMSDLEWSPDDILRLINHSESEDYNCQIFTPAVLTLPNQAIFYDTWAFRGIDGNRFRRAYPWHPDLIEKGLCQISSAGTCLVMKGQVARDCRACEEEAVSFCDNASYEGYSVAIDLEIWIVHSPKQTYSILWISDAVCISGFSRVAHSLFPLLSEAGFDLEIVAQNYYGTPHNFPYLIWPANVNGEDPSGTLRMQNLLWTNRNKYDAIVVLDDPWNVPRVTKGIASVSELIWKEESSKDFTPPPIISWVTVDGRNTNQKDLYGTFPVPATTFGLLEIQDTAFGNNIPVVPFGVDSSIFKPLDRLECRKLTCGDGSIIPYDSFIVGTVSNNQLRKNLHLVIESFSDWVHRYGRSDAYLYLCLGKESETGCDVESLVRYYDLRNRVIVNRSALPDEILAKVYNSFDLFVSLSSEGFGLCALEAMSCGVPCVLTDWSGYSSWVPNDAAIKIPCSHTQLTAPLNSQTYVIGGVADKEKVVTALQKLYTFSEMREKLSVRGREVANELNWKNTADKLVNVLERVIEKGAIKNQGTDDLCQWPECIEPALCTSGNFGGKLLCSTHFNLTNGVEAASNG